jgi:hypothetical protein
MSVIFYEEAVHRVLRSPIGPVGRDLARRAENVTRQATENASHRGPTTLGIVTGDLHSSIHFTIEEGVEDLKAFVGSPAEHHGLHYPTYWDRNGHPWLSSALPEALV